MRIGYSCQVFGELYIQKIGSGHERFFELYSCEILPCLHSGEERDGAAGEGATEQTRGRTRRTGVSAKQPFKEQRWQPRSSAQQRSAT